jgi:hypothetical protein
VFNPSTLYVPANPFVSVFFDLDGNEIRDEFVCANQSIMMYEPVLPGREQ